MSLRLFATEDTARALGDADADDAKAARTRANVAKHRATEPTTLGECRHGDLVMVTVRITADIAGARFGRFIIASGKESELTRVPAEAVVMTCLERST